MPQYRPDLTSYAAQNLARAASARSTSRLGLDPPTGPQLIPIAPPNPIFTESFTAANGSAAPSPWIANTFGGTQNVQSNQWRMVSPGSYTGTAMTYGTTSYADADMQITLTIHNPVLEQYPALMGRGGAGTNGWDSPFAEQHQGYTCWFDTLAGQLHLDKYTAGASTIDLSTPRVATAGASYHMRLQCIGSRIRMALWPAGTTQDHWDLEMTDATYSTGLWGFRDQAATTSTQANWDDFILDDGTSGSVVQNTTFLLPVGSTLAAADTKLGNVSFRLPLGADLQAADQHLVSFRLGAGAALRTADQHLVSFRLGAGAILQAPDQHLVSFRLPAGAMLAAGGIQHLVAFRWPLGATLGALDQHLVAFRLPAGATILARDQHLVAFRLPLGAVLASADQHLVAFRWPVGETVAAGGIQHLVAFRLPAGGALKAADQHLVAFRLPAGASVRAADTKLGNVAFTFPSGAVLGAATGRVVAFRFTVGTSLRIADVKLGLVSFALPAGAILRAAPAKLATVQFRIPAGGGLRQQIAKLGRVAFTFPSGAVLLIDAEQTGGAGALQAPVYAALIDGITGQLIAAGPLATLIEGIEGDVSHNGLLATLIEGIEADG